jgi:hypothetical protein
MLWADRVSDGGSWAILARDFRRKPSRVGRAKEERGPVETDAHRSSNSNKGLYYLKFIEAVVHLKKAKFRSEEWGAPHQSAIQPYCHLSPAASQA